MSNSYYNHGSWPATGSTGTSSPARAEFDLVAAGFALLPTLAANGNKLTQINSGGTAMTVASGLTDDGTTFTVSHNLVFGTYLGSDTALATPSALAATGHRTFASTVSGAALMGYGTTNDVSLMNRAGTVCLGVGPNTTTINIPGALSVTGAITGNLTGNASGTAATVTGAAQTSITSVGTLTSVTSSGAISGTAGTFSSTLKLSTNNTSLAGVTTVAAVKSVIKLNNANKVMIDEDALGAITGGSLAISSIGAFVASDKYVTIDASGNLHKSAIGPAS